MEYQQLTPDAETFRRVWKRVMPDESLSPIAVHTSPRGRTAPPPTPCAPEPEGEEELLRAMLENLEEGTAGAGELLRRAPMARPLVQSLNASLRRARSAWFLLTGRRWEGKRRTVNANRPLGALLREQYLRELELSRLCRETEKNRSQALREAAAELEEESRRRRGMIRNLLTGN